VGNMDYKLKGFIINTLRRASYRWPPRNEALKLAKVDRNQYKCAHCTQIFGRKDVQIDHKIPVVSLQGFTSWDDYVSKMFCDLDGFQILCTSCHDSKTLVENQERKANRPTKKKK
jgi:5-methylcytosine-specific restriction endonuclease McrA